MKNFKNFFGAAGILAAATLGAGIFALPYVFEKSGWLAGVFYLAILSAFVIFVHYLYWLVLEKVREEERLLGLVKIYLGEKYFWLAFLSVILGLLLTLVAYLILSGKFLGLIFPAAGGTFGILLFWILSSLPLVLMLPRFAGLELLGAVLMFGLILLIFFASLFGGKFQTSAVSFGNFFFPFGPVLFSLAGWTAIEPIFDLRQKRGGFNLKAVLMSGTLVTALFYLIFVLAILASATSISADTISGLANWPSWKISVLAWLGLFAIWTSYLPIGLEIKNALEKDLGWRRGTSVAVVIFSPLVLLAFGFKDFLNIVALAGGVFLALQYVFIILVGKKVLEISGSRKMFMDFLVLVFLLAAAYEVYYFIK